MGAVGAINDAAGTKHLEMVGALQAVAARIDTAAHEVQPHITDPTGGLNVDTEARTAISAILDLLVATGLMEPA